MIKVDFKLSKLQSSKLIYFLLALVLFFIYWPLIKNDPLIFSRDDYSIINPLKSISSLSEYIQLISSKIRYDIQPITDLTYLIDISIGRFFEISTFHLTNLLVWIATIISFSKLLRTWNPTIKNTVPFILLFSTHPIVSMSVSWISARKHLLGALFLILSLNYFLKFLRDKSLRNYSIFFLLLFLSLASHPLYSMWILWAPLLLLIENKKYFKENFKFLLLPILMVLTTLNIHYNHYLSLYEKNGLYQLQETFKNSYLPDLGKIFFGLGRYFLNLFLPFNFSMSYDHFHHYNLIGFFMGVLVLIFTSKIDRTKFLICLSFILFPLGIVLWKIQVTLNDTYLIWPLTGLIVLLSFQKIPFNKYSKLIWGTVLISFILISRKNALAWQSSEDLFKMSFSNSKDCVTGSDLATELYRKRKYDDANSIAKFILHEKCNTTKSYLILQNYVYFSGDFSNQEKIDFFLKSSLKSEQAKLYYASSIFELEERREEALAVINEILRKNIINIPLLLSLPQTEKFLKFCEQNHKTTMCEELNSTIKKIQPASE